MRAQVLTPVVTLFQPDGTLDREGNPRLWAHLLEGGVDGIVLMGSTGEFFGVSQALHHQLIDLAAEKLVGRTKVLLGVGGMRADEVIQMANYALERGLSEVMVISPYYFSLPEEHLEAYYGQVARGTQAHIYLYNFPDRTGHDLSPALVARLAQSHANIVGLKDTVTNVGHTTTILQAVKAVRPDFAIYSGYDDNLVHMAFSGGAGVIGGLSNLMPAQARAWADALEREDFAQAARLQQYFDSAMAIYGVADVFIPALKRGLQKLGLPVCDRCTAPLLPLNDTQDAVLTEHLVRLGLIPG